MKNRSSQLGIPILLVILSVFATGCFWGDPSEVFAVPPCECPNTERIALNTDWFGTGRAADSKYSWGGGLDGSETPHVNVDFDSFATLADANAALDQLVSHFAEGGLPPFEYRSANTAFLPTEDARVTVWAPFVGREDGLLLIKITVSVFVDDSQAPDVLTPFVEALGTLS